MESLLETHNIKGQYNNNKPAELVRFSNEFVLEFFDSKEALNIPIDALRIMFNIVSIIRNDQFQSTNKPYQLELFDKQYLTENNTFAKITIPNNVISPNRQTKRIKNAYEFLVKFKQGWYKSINYEGKEKETYGGLISIPTYDKGSTTFLISSYWLKKLINIPSYNTAFYNLVYNISNNVHVLFWFWLSTLKPEGTAIKLETLNDKYDLNYKSNKDIIRWFLKPIKANFDKYSDKSFNVSIKNGLIIIVPYTTKNLLDQKTSKETLSKHQLRYKLKYIEKRHSLLPSQIITLKQIIFNHPYDRNIVFDAYKLFTTKNRGKTTEFKSLNFLNTLQKFIIEVYTTTTTGKMNPNGYPKII